MMNTKLNSIKTFLLAFAITSITLVACDTSKKDVKKEMNEIEAEAKEEIKEGKAYFRKTFKIKDSADVAYDYDDLGIVAVKDWSDYTVVNAELENFKASKYKINRNRVNNLNKRISNLEASIPRWLQTEDVLDEVKDVKEEYAKLINNVDASDEEMEEALEDFNEEFAELRKELNDTVEKYREIHKDAIEEFNEEIKSDGDLDDAIEEYNEEIKEIEKMIEK